MQKNIKKYIYIADASADASPPRFLENDASALRASASLPLRATLHWSFMCFMLIVWLMAIAYIMFCL
jgi:hypothetical protein